MIRLDGHRFSKFTKGFKRPYDERSTRRPVSAPRAHRPASRRGHAPHHRRPAVVLQLSPGLHSERRDHARLRRARGAWRASMLSPSATTQPPADGTAAQHPYNGVVQKIATLASGCAAPSTLPSHAPLPRSYGTARFIAHMSAQVFGPNETEVRRWASGGCADVDRGAAEGARGLCAL